MKFPHLLVAVLLFGFISLPKVFGQATIVFSATPNTNFSEVFDLDIEIDSSGNLTMSSNNIPNANVMDSDQIAGSLPPGAGGFRIAVTGTDSGGAERPRLDGSQTAADYLANPTDNRGLAVRRNPDNSLMNPAEELQFTFDFTQTALPVSDVTLTEITFVANSGAPSIRLTDSNGTNEVIGDTDSTVFSALTGDYTFTDGEIFRVAHDGATGVFAIKTLSFTATFQQSIDFTASTDVIFGTENVSLTISDPAYEPGFFYEIDSDNIAFNGGLPLDITTEMDNGSGTAVILVALDGTTGDYNFTIFESSPLDAPAVSISAPPPVINEFTFADPVFPNSSSLETTAYLFTTPEGNSDAGTRGVNGLGLFYNVGGIDETIGTLAITSSDSVYSFFDTTVTNGAFVVNADDPAVDTIYTLTLENGNGVATQDVQVLVDEPQLITNFSLNGFQIGDTESGIILLNAVGDHDDTNAAQGLFLDWSLDGVNFVPVPGIGVPDGDVTDLTRDGVIGPFGDTYANGFANDSIGLWDATSVLAALSTTSPATVTARLRSINQIDTTLQTIVFDILEDDTLPLGFWEADNGVNGEPWQNSNIKTSNANPNIPILTIPEGGFADTTSNDVTFTRAFSGRANMGGIGSFSNGDASFALWADLPTASADRLVLIDLGGGADGVSVVYENGEIVLTHFDSAATTTISQVVPTGWTHIAIVIDFLSDPAAPVIDLYIDSVLSGTLVGTDSSGAWAGGNTSGIGGQFVSTAGGSGTTFTGDITHFVVATTLLDQAAIDALYFPFAILSNPPEITGFTFDPVTGSAEISLSGEASTNYKLVEASDLDFTTPDQDPIPLTGATVGTQSGNEVITDATGNATVQFNLGTTKTRTYVRAETP